MSVFKDLDTIISYAHMWNWVPDWEVVTEIYKKFPNSYSVLTPFAYAYLEEVIRSTTSEYRNLRFVNNKQLKVKVGMALLALAIEENKANTEYIELLEKMKKHFRYTDELRDENGRNNIMHGHLHPRFWTKEAFEQLIHDIAELSPYSKF